MIVVDGIEHACEISNVSLGGAMIVADVDVRMADRVQLRFVVLSIAEAMHATATVRWRTDGELGLQFDGLRAREVWALGHFVARMQRAA